MTSVVRRSSARRRLLLAGTAIVGIVVAGGIAVAGLPGSPGPGTPAALPNADWKLTSAPAIDRRQATDTARRTVPDSTVDSAELDTERETGVWEIDVETPDGTEYEVTIDATTGAVLSTEIDRD
ncbi:PepSY domain-containing protein [Nocardia otitidiscaviarum]|uniref:PepSY domain-containing protein n=1 Tax=Nocardia otitidiscaviarum TaxID=1823 RepID=UPI0004A7208A|nr:PepSY domain-containing protein [Nocardia otitidiscaviarum]MBF6137652.1 PepSY domain-containing protein [Nocardia otitidiscaviarum]MBF6488560.1 PepSY domain-containing protein [Nocardia otitidiscaviarum]